MGQVWKIAPGVGAEDWELFRKHGCIGLGWLPNENYKNFESEAEVLATLVQRRGNVEAGNGAGAAKMIWRFVHEVKQQHIVVANERYNRVVGIGVITSDYLSPESKLNPIRKDKTTHRHHVRRVNWLVTNPIDLPGNRFFVQSTLWPLENEKLVHIRQTYAAKYPLLKTTLDQLFVGLQAGIGGLLPEEVIEVPKLFEGAVQQVLVNAFERNQAARKKCISVHGTTCCICGFRFGAMYGPDAEGYIHVHHIKPLSEVRNEYVVDPVRDLRPVCPNCHAVLHLGGGCRSIEEVRQLLRQQSQAKVIG